MKQVLLVITLIVLNSAHAQDSSAVLTGSVSAMGKPAPGILVTLEPIGRSATTDSLGVYRFEQIPEGKSRITFSAHGYRTVSRDVHVVAPQTTVSEVVLSEDTNSLDEVVVTGTLKAVSRIESAVPVEVYSPAFFKKNPTANIFEALQNVNGVRPQLNCNVCNTGDIHINGLEGPYTLVLIDGMPIVSGLSTVYGLAGIPSSLLERIEIVKGPASSLYGSEAVGGLINIITKSPGKAPRFVADGFATSWGEANIDLGFKSHVGGSSFITGINYFNYSNPIDNNGDNFTDVTLQDRLSVFQKWNVKRKSNKMFSLAGRVFYEDRWGGEMQWQKKHRGGSDVYGESIYTKRWELLGSYELPFSEKMLLSLSYADHDQNSVYGNVYYLAKQRIGFSQLTWDKKWKGHDMLFGTAVRYQYYNDNTTATKTSDETWIPGIFAQDEVKFSEGHSILLGARYDYNNRHGSIFTPRFAYKWKITDNDILRLNSGTGFRVVNLFTEEHAALTGSREVIITETLRPERSYNVNLNYLKKLYSDSGYYFGLEATAWYTYFTNSIIPDYDSDPNQIIYKNLDGFAVTKGISFNADVVSPYGLKVILGATYMDVSKTENSIETRQILTERFSGTWALSYHWSELFLDIDYTGNVYGPMRLPLLGPLDPRKEYSDTWSIQNIQFTFKKFRSFEVYCGIKNLLDWTPNKGNPFIIARANDPFDKNVQYDNNGAVVPSTDNPYALTFDPGYVYGPNQGLRTFAGLRYIIK